jgi:protein disulfide-isomerase A5
MDVDKSENYKIRTIYNITGFPTILFFKNGNLEFPYGGEYNKNGLVEWMQNPEPAKPKEPEVSWADEEDVYVTFLTTDTFDSYIETHQNVLVKFYAPCNFFSNNFLLNLFVKL